DDTIGDLPCRVLLPVPYEPAGNRYPLVVTLHGSAERGNDNLAQLRNGVRSFEMLRAKWPCIVVAPQLPHGENFGGSWYGGASAGQRRLLRLLEELEHRKSVDEERVYGVGFSMGAIGLWDLLVRRPGLFAASVLIAGDLDPVQATPLSHVSLWAFHGAADEVVSPVNVRRFFEEAQRRGGTARYTETPGVGHEVWREVYGHLPTWEWLFNQRRQT
ncbi:MAG: PHB depolymerase family esterase, partial [Myxococcota bacterium]